MSFLLDTDVCSSYLRGNRPLYSKFQQYSGRISLSTVVVGELLTWSFRRSAPSSRSAAIQRLLEHVEILSVDSEVAEVYGRVQAHLLDCGKPKGRSDLFIAATALVHNLTLVTHNARHFIDVPDLRLDDWLAP